MLCLNTVPPDRLHSERKQGGHEVVLGPFQMKCSVFVHCCFSLRAYLIFFKKHFVGILFPDLCLINYLTGTLNVGRPHQGRGQCKGNRKCSSIFSQTPSYWTCWSLVTGQNAQVERLKVGVIPHKQWPGRGWCTWHSDMACLEVVFSGGGMNLCRGLLSLTSQWGSVALCDGTTCRLSQRLFVCAHWTFILSGKFTHWLTDTLVKWILDQMECDVIWCIKHLYLT